MLAITKILVPIDFSNVSGPATGYAISLAKDHGAGVILLHTVPATAMKQHFSESYTGEGLFAPVGTSPGANQHRGIENLVQTRKQIVHNFLEQRIESELLKAVKINTVIRFGRVVEEIVMTAKEEQCDLIVMTSHASRLRRLFHGSITDRVVQRAPCPVLSLQPFAEVRMEKDKRVPINLIEKWAA
jgi:nucleotide-binding universal stress UspA family protein